MKLTPGDLAMAKNPDEKRKTLADQKAFFK